MTTGILRIQDSNFSTPTERVLYRELVKATAELQKLKSRADYDALTGCLRREAFLDLFATRRQMGMLPKNMTLAIVDIDHFKKINDTHGHAIGDEALKIFSACLRDHAPRGSLICRMGGEEFCLVLENSIEKTLPELENLRQKITELIVKSPQGNFRMSASIGAVSMDSSEEILKVAIDADVNLYRAKTEGRNRIAA